MGNWYYSINGRQTGPLNEEELQQKVKDGIIERETLVWGGDGDWQPAKDILKGAFGDTPPKLELKHKWVWVLFFSFILTPIITDALPLEAKILKTLVYYGIIYIILKADQKELRSKGYKAPSELLGTAIPYLYVLKRQEITRDDSSYSKWFSVAFWLGVVILVIGIGIILFGDDIGLADKLVGEFLSSFIWFVLVMVGDKDESDRVGMRSPSLSLGILFPPYYVWKKRKYSEGNLILSTMVLLSYIAMVVSVVQFLS